MHGVSAYNINTNVLALLLGMCDNCTYVNGVGYKGHWAQCDLFVQCQFTVGGALEGQVRHCPHGLHWSQDILTCVTPQQARCRMG